MGRPCHKSKRIHYPVAANDESEQTGGKERKIKKNTAYISKSAVAASATRLIFALPNTEVMNVTPSKTNASRGLGSAVLGI
jgi:hypothetical protein